MTSDLNFMDVLNTKSTASLTTQSGAVLQSRQPRSWSDDPVDRWFQMISPIFIILTTIGNPLSIVTLQNPLFRRSSTSFLLSALAVVDIGVIYTGLLRQWTDAAFNVDVRVMSSAACKMHTYFTYLFRQVAALPCMSIFSSS